MRPRTRQALKLLGTGVIALAVVAALVDQLTPSSSGPTSSSYATSADGLAGYAELLAKTGYGVTRLRALPRTASSKRITPTAITPPISNVVVSNLITSN